MEEREKPALSEQEGPVKVENMVLILAADNLSAS